MADTGKTYELRTYHAAPGKLDALLARFRDHVMGLFEKHGIGVVGFWVPERGSDESAGSLVYLLSFADRTGAERCWGSFRADPAWTSLKEETERGGPLSTRIDSVYLSPTDFSPLR